MNGSIRQDTTRALATFPRPSAAVCGVVDPKDAVTFNMAAAVRCGSIDRRARGCIIRALTECFPQPRLHITSEDERLNVPLYGHYSRRGTRSKCPYNRWNSPATKFSAHKSSSQWVVFIAHRQFGSIAPLRWWLFQVMIPYLLHKWPLLKLEWVKGYRDSALGQIWYVGIRSTVVARWTAG